MERIGLAGLLLLAASGLLAEATGTTTADLRGLVDDKAGSPLPGASITVTNEDSGFSRQATSDAGGSFVVRLLPPGLYRVSASFGGFRVVDVPNVRLSVGTTTTLELHIAPSEVAESVLVTAETPLVDRTSTELSKTIGESKIRGLPINQRNFLEFALTTPGVTVDRGPQVGSFPTSGISINGQSPRYNNIVVDGLDNNDPATGSVRSTFSQEAVREYQVIQSPFSAEYGRTAGGVVNAVTRSGTNTWHGSAFTFYRDESLSADNALTETTTPFRQLQYGASLSGAILRDRLFFFAAGERLAVADANVVTISDADIAMIRSNGFDVHNGVITFDRNGTATLGKLDFLPSPSHALSLRGTNARALDENQQPWGGLVARSNGGVGNIEDAAVALTCTSVLTGNLSNELRALYAHHSNRLESLDPSRSPQVTILGVAAFGTQPLLPQPRDTKGLEVFDAISWSGSRGAYKAGFDYTHTAFAVSVPATFAGAYQFSALQEGLPGVPAGGLTAREAFAAGLPYSFAQGFGDPYWKGTTTVLGVLRAGRVEPRGPPAPAPRPALRLREAGRSPSERPEQLGAEVVFLLGGRRRVACAGRPRPILRRRRDRPDVRDRGQQRHPDDLRQPGPGRGLRRDVPGGAVEPAGPPLPGSGERRGGPLPPARRAARRLRERDAPEPRPRGLRSIRECQYRPGQPRIRAGDRPAADRERRLPVRPREEHPRVAQHQPSDRRGTPAEPRLCQHLPRLGRG